jgi:hypothetical protein
MNAVDARRIGRFASGLSGLPAKQGMNASTSLDRKTGHGRADGGIRHLRFRVVEASDAGA